MTDWEKEFDEVLKSEGFECYDGNNWSYRGMGYGNHPLSKIRNFIAQQRAKVLDELVEKAKDKRRLDGSGNWYVIDFEELKNVAEEMKNGKS